MKKLLSLLAVTFLVLPFTVKAAGNSIEPKCEKADTEGNITCVVNYNFTDTLESLNIGLTEKGGADIISVEGVTGSDWNVDNWDENNGNVLLLSPGVSGEGDLFKFTYKPSGEEDCEVKIKLNDIEVSVKPETNKPTDNKDTGVELPIIALGSIALIAAVAYVSTKNKAKMYRI